jgi:polyisoprenoid-binding protein YceI
VSEDAPRRRSPLRWIVGGLVVLALLVVGGPFVYIHFIEGPPPKPLALPQSTTTSTDRGAPSATATTAFPTGIWHTVSTSQVGYRVNEVLFGQNHVAVGRTHSITGAITVAGAHVTLASFTVQMSTVQSDQSQRDHQFDGRIMDVASYPTATFTLTSPIALNRRVKPGATLSATATGKLTLRGQTHPVTFPVTAMYSSDSIEIQGSIPITFATWNVPNPGFAGISTDDNGVLEFLLNLRPGSTS